MSEIRAAAGSAQRVPVVSGDVRPELVAQQVGEATIYFRVSGETLVVANEPELRPVAAGVKSNIFDEAASIVGEGVRIIGQKIHALTETLQPSELEIELSFGFEVKGTATIVPVLLTGESKSNVGLKVTATWKQPETKQPEPEAKK
jgi:hypothetical protein